MLEYIGVGTLWFTIIAIVLCEAVIIFIMFRVARIYDKSVGKNIDELPTTDIDNSNQPQ